MFSKENTFSFASNIVTFDQVQNISNKSFISLDSGKESINWENIMTTICEESTACAVALRSGASDKEALNEITRMGEQALSLEQGADFGDKITEFLYNCRTMENMIEDERKSIGAPLRKELAALKKQGDAAVNTLSALKDRALDLMTTWAENNAEVLETVAGSDNLKFEGEKATFYIKEENRIVEIDVADLPKEFMVPNEKLIAELVNRNQQIKGVKTESVKVASFRCKSKE